MLWAKFSISTIFTNNNCEAYHSKFSCIFYSSHPNILKFIDVIKNAQCEIYIKIRNTKTNITKNYTQKIFVPELKTKYI